MYRKYYSYNDMPQLLKHEPPKGIKPDKQELCEASSEKCDSRNESRKLFGKFELDDIIIAAVILALLIDDCDDNLLLIALGFVFLTGII
ncbi:MAG: hypothetical protein PUB42_00190 [Firmicutes bacterium]|nr:hypothetical protein [Bacillota bacterium]